MSDAERTTLAVLGIAQVASTALTEQIVTSGGAVSQIRSSVEASVYWPEFRRLVAAGIVDASFLPGPLGVAVIGWADISEET